MNCPRRDCDGIMSDGVYIAQTYAVGMPDFPGDSSTLIRTMYPGGPGRLDGCLKCDKCGYSVTVAISAKP